MLHLTRPPDPPGPFQNWQSEFLAVGAIVVLSIFLRQYRSPESKPVIASNAETGS